MSRDAIVIPFRQLAGIDNPLRARQETTASRVWFDEAIV